jgi:hypothetical protein
MDAQRLMVAALALLAAWYLYHDNVKSCSACSYSKKCPFKER